MIPIFPRPSPDQQSPLVNSDVNSPSEMPDDTIFINCPSKFVGIGGTVYPFAGLQFISSTPLSSARYRKDGGGWNTITVGSYTDLYQAIILTSETITVFGTFDYELELTNGGAEVQSVNVDVICKIVLTLDKATTLK